MAVKGKETEGPDSNTLEEIEHGQRIKVLDGPNIHVELDSRVDHNCEAIYSILTDPKADKVFRSIQACTDRKVLEDNHGRRKIQVSHRAISKFLWISVTFETHLYVWEDDRERSIRFTNARAGFMKRFEGAWHVRPYTQQSLREVCASPSPGDAPASGHHNIHHHPFHFQPNWFNPGAMLHAAQRLIPHAPVPTSLVSLEQRIEPNITPPAPIRSLIRHLVAKQLKDMMEDLKTELERRKRGDFGGRPDKRKKSANLPATTASISRAAVDDIWQHCEPLVNITIQL